MNNETSPTKDFSPIVSGDAITDIHEETVTNLENLEITPMVAVSNDSASATRAMEMEMEKLVSTMPSPPNEYSQKQELGQQSWQVKPSSNGTGIHPGVQVTETNSSGGIPTIRLTLDQQQHLEQQQEQVLSLPSKDFSIGSKPLGGSTSIGQASGTGVSPSISNSSLHALSRNSSSDALSRSLSGGSLNTLGISPSTRRQRRLERNRESARLSRRRRKQYLEVLEEKVATLSEQMDKGRCDHVAAAIPAVCSLRTRLLTVVEKQLASIDEKKRNGNNNVQGTLLEDCFRALSGPISRTSKEFSISLDFQKEQLRCLTLPSHSKFLLWLTLQNDSYFRGGRAASERLSAARIGEKVSHSIF